MQLLCAVCKTEHREIDGFDLLSVLGLIKEYNWQEIWRRYRLDDTRGDSISMYVPADNYFLEMHVQKMQRIILSEKFNTNPFFMQQVVQRIIASHDHDLIMEKIRKQGIDTGANPISLSCSMGNVIIDLIANKNDPFPDIRSRAPGETPIEKAEKRPIDVYDLSSTLYLCQQNLTDAIFRRYGHDSGGSTPGADPTIKLVTRVGMYEVTLQFRCVSTDTERIIPPPGNVSVATVHQVLMRMYFRHSKELILKELGHVGLSVTPDHVDTEFTLRRYINNTALRLDFRSLNNG